MKKFIVGLLSLVMIMFMAGVGFAGGSLDVDSHAEQSVSDVNGIGALDGNYGAGSFYSGSGEADSSAFGYVLDYGELEGDVSTTGGGLGNSNSETWNPDISPSDNDFGVKTESYAEGITSSSVDTKAYGSGGVWGDMSGETSEMTISSSYIGDSVSNPDTYGITYQSAGGSFDGKNWAMFSEEEFMSASLDVWGNSYSESYNYTINDGDKTTVGKGTNVGSFTNVESSKEVVGSNTSYVNGNWSAGGYVHTETSQTDELGEVTATATGYYGGSGGLGSNYEGSAQGYTSTSVTTVDDMQGSIRHSESHMSVTSQVD